MDDKGLTTIALKKINKTKVYQYIYKQKQTYKLQIVQDLQMGLSTVSQNLNQLEKEGLIERNGYFDSTGGRKAQVIQINRTARISIGIGILKDCIHLVAVDLYGDTIQTDTLQIAYQSSAVYYKTIGNALQAFIEAAGYVHEAILGVSIAVQGIISTDGQFVNYGVIMENSQMKLTDFTDYIPYPCRLEHDSKAAGFFELWTHPEIENAVVYLLNHNLGGALILNGQLYRGQHMQSGLLEHFCVNPNGPACYCGQQGCLETYCSVNAFINAAGADLTVFFNHVRQGELSALQIWNDYLRHFAFAIRNVNMITDCPIILSGYLAPYFIEKDIETLCSYINQSNAFPMCQEQILIGTKGQFTPAIGAALFYIDAFLTAVMD